MCTDKTSHAKAAEVEYDPSEVPYEELLNKFWKNDKPTTHNW